MSKHKKSGNNMQIMQVYSKDCASSCPYITTIVDGISICTHAGVPCLSVPDDECADQSGFKRCGRHIAYL